MNAKHSLFLSLLLITACGAPSNQELLHNLPPTRKDTPQTIACNAAQGRVQMALSKSPGATSSVINPPTGCAVSIVVPNADAALPAMKTLKAAVGSYAVITSTNGRQVPMWIAVKAPAPTHDKNGNAAKPEPVTGAMCLKAVRQAAQLNPTATVTDKSTGNSRAFPYPCYVDVAFHDDGSFEGFFTADNPYSLTHDIFHMDFASGNTGGHASVFLHAYRLP